MNLKEQIARFEFDLVLDVSLEHEFNMTTETWEELEPINQEYYLKRADSILVTIREHVKEVELTNRKLEKLFEILRKKYPVVFSAGTNAYRQAILKELE